MNPAEQRARINEIYKIIYNLPENNIYEKIKGYNGDITDPLGHNVINDKSKAIYILSDFYRHITL